MAAVAFEAITETRERIRGRIAQTPMTISATLTAACGAPIFLKQENRQITGSFKLRGASNAVLSLTAAQRAAGLVTASTGNHGRALAHAAKATGVKSVVCMSALVPQNKVEAVRNLGADIRIVGRSQDDAQDEVERLVAEHGLIAIPPFDHPDVIAGQGTIGLEIMDDCPETELVLVPLSGGGLAAGIAAAVKGRRPRTRVIGVSMERGAAMAASLKAGRPIFVEEVETLADSLGGGIGSENKFTFEMCRTLLDDVVLVSENEIADGIRHAFSAEGEIVEGAGAVGIAALLSGKVKAMGPAIALLSGCNIDRSRHQILTSNKSEAI